MIFVVQEKRFSTLVEKAIFLIYFFFGDKSLLGVVKARHLNPKIALGVRYTPCDHEGAMWGRMGNLSLVPCTCSLIKHIIGVIRSLRIETLGVPRGGYITQINRCGQVRGASRN